MSGKRPKSIFTDQSVVMAKAIATVLSDTHHRLCTWHIFQNALKHLNHVFRQGTKFRSDFSRCIYEYESESEFLAAWERMLNGHDLKEEWKQTYAIEIYHICDKDEGSKFKAVDGSKHRESTLILKNNTFQIASLAAKHQAKFDVAREMNLQTMRTLEYTYKGIASFGPDGVPAVNNIEGQSNDGIVEQAGPNVIALARSGKKQCGGSSLSRLKASIEKNV
ncbi:hypothetical protein H6P81_016183 [Aristolochia fimbriata]|uniref:Protein FAR1-RELATED SEQUENCE n=1 Tax=Aristolochia fimbriata TaxID=158543 RepID=A0AAV7EC74_ARIFI|nr:hypothetical protein H6P81_016183 [Aristolochia fimbriata]